MTAQTMQIGNRPCRIYGEPHAEYLLLQMTVHRPGHIWLTVSKNLCGFGKVMISRNIIKYLIILEINVHNLLLATDYITCLLYSLS